MFGKNVVTQLINRSATNETNRRHFLRTAGLAGMGVLGATALSPLASAEAATNAVDLDVPILNFALNLEYLEAEFYHRAFYGNGLSSAQVGGNGDNGGRVTGGRKVSFNTGPLAGIIGGVAQEIAKDEVTHVDFLRSALGSEKVAEPNIDLDGAFSALGFDPFASPTNFLLGAFVFEDVGVTAYKGAAPLITNKAYLSAAAGILSVEAYHSGAIRALLLAADAEDSSLNLKGKASAIAGLRDKLDGPQHDDQGIGIGKSERIAVVDANSIAFSRTPAEVLNIVYGKPGTGVSSGLFFPNGMNGALKTS